MDGQGDRVHAPTQAPTGHPFPHATASSDEIKDRAAGLVGHRLIDLRPEAPMVPSSARTKGVVGKLYEACFDIAPNSIKGPDFAAAGIELKSVPILVTRGESRAKERISVGMIDFRTLAREVWDTAEARKKLASMLLIFYGWQPLQPIARFRTLAAGIWSPDAETWKAIEADWRTIHAIAATGDFDRLSESLTAVLGAATKGPGHGSTSRAWSLKQPFVTWMYRTMVGAESDRPMTPAADPRAQFESDVMATLESYVGKSFDALVRTAGRDGKGGKSAVATTVRSLLGQPAKGRRAEFDRFGIETKTVPVDASGRVVEAMSFPAFVHEEIIFESWDSSDLLGRLNRLLIVPIHREPGAPLVETVLGRPFFWNPLEPDLRGIRDEWERFRLLIVEGRAGALPHESETTFTHVRPHGRNAADQEIAPGGFQVGKKSFWLNRPYLERVLGEHDALVRPPRR